jgi:ribosome maturation factor RimP
MGKRQIILTQDKITAKLVGEEANIEVGSSKIWHGYITSVTGDALTFKDTRQKEHTVKLSDVKRLFLERVTEY